MIVGFIGINARLLVTNTKSVSSDSGTGSDLTASLHARIIREIYDFSENDDAMTGLHQSAVLNRDRFGRTINYLRLSVTDRCNLRCCYCMPSEGVPARSHAEILSYEELIRIAEAAVDLGIRKVRVTGGEPLVRTGLTGFLERLSVIPGLDEVSLTTNGVMLASFAMRLKQAGVDRLNVSIDSLRPDVYAQITRGGTLDQTLTGLKAAEQAGLKIKLNMVVMRGINDGEVEDFAALSLARPWSVRYIEYMPTIREKSWRSQIVSGAEILERLRQSYSLTALETSRVCGPARPFRIKGALGTVGIITPMSDHFCHSCNRIRVTATGLAKSCLLSERALDLKPALAQSDTVLRQALIEVIDSKESRHSLGGEGSTSAPFSMASIGG